MSSAQSYTNKVKIIAQAKNTKVDYPGHVATNSTLLKATIGCSPNYTVQNYRALPLCGRIIATFTYQTNCPPESAFIDGPLPD